MINYLLNKIEETINKNENNVLAITFLIFLAALIITNNGFLTSWI